MKHYCTCCHSTRQPVNQNIKIDTFTALNRFKLQLITMKYIGPFFLLPFIPSLSLLSLSLQTLITKALNFLNLDPGYNQPRALLSLTIDQTLTLTLTWPLTSKVKQLNLTSSHEGLLQVARIFHFQLHSSPKRAATAELTNLSLTVFLTTGSNSGDSNPFSDTSGMVHNPPRPSSTL